MKVKKNFFGWFAILILIVICQNSYAAPGGTSNPTGGFGQITQSSSTTPNPVGGFGGSDPGTNQPLAGPPPPPPDPTPLDGGVSFLLAATLGLGIKKIYGEVNKK